jgi:hypothetical protein
MNQETKFETGATSHAVNDLVLFTDNTRELAQLRDNIYFTHQKLDNKTVKPEDFSHLFTSAMQGYIKEFGRMNSKHISAITREEKREFCELYAKDFEDWKKEHPLTNLQG